MFELFAAFGAFQGLVLAVILLARHKGNNRANRFLGSFVGLYSLLLINGVLKELFKSEEFSSHLYMLMAPVTYLFGPLFYFYVVSTTAIDKANHRKFWLHAVLAVAMVAFCFPFYISDGLLKLQMIESGEGPFPWFFEINTYLQTTSGFVYVLASIGVLLRYRLTMKDRFSYTKGVSLSWLIYLISALFVFVLCVVIDLASGHQLLPSWLFSVIPAVIFYSIGYAGLIQPQIFSGAQEWGNGKSDGALPEESTMVEPPPRKYQKSKISPETAEAYRTDLMGIMKSEKLYLDANLTLAKLAKSLRVSPHHLSQTINQQFQKNFFDFVNSYRIAAAQSCLRENPTTTILDVAYAVGFNSKSTFYSAFKKVTGMTPLQFLKSVSPDS